MKFCKKIILTVVFCVATSFILVGCSSSNLTSLKVGASPSPHAEILRQVQPILEKEGIQLEIVEFTDYVLPNRALENDEIEANFFQHQPYLDDFNAKNGTSLVSVGTVHFEPLGIYPGKSSDLSSIPSGAKISVPNDSTNEARALLLLEKNGILTLREGVGLSATVKDIVENPYHVEIVEIDAASLARTLDDADFAVINGNVAVLSGITDTVLASEKSDTALSEQFANIVAVKSENATKPEIQKLITALHSDEIRQFIQQQYGDLFVSVF